MNNQTIKIRNMQTINNITEQTGRSPYIGENGNWFEFNDETQSFVDSGVLAKGIKGEKGDKGDTGKQGVQGENGKDALINGVNVLNLLAGDNIELEQDNNNLVIKAIVINNLTTINDTAALSATQGKILKDSLDSLNDTIGNINTILSTLTTVEEVSD